MIAPRFDKTINKTILINAPVSKVWDLLTTSESMKLWMSDEEINIFSDWKVGGSIIFHGKIHGTDYKDKGYILEFEPGKIFQYSYWSEISEFPDALENYSVIRFSLNSNAGKTTFEFSQNNFVTEVAYKHWELYWNVTLQLFKNLAEQHSM